jgi:chromosome segregation ATPase
MGKSYEERMAEKYNFLNKDDEKKNFSQIEENNNSANEYKNNLDQENDNANEESLLVPLDAWNTVLNQLGNLHEASQQMAEARERAAKAESEAEFLREKLKNTRQQLEEVNKKKKFFFF